MLYWNQDTVRMSAGLHRDFVHLALENALTRLGTLEVLDTPIDLGLIDVPTYVIRTRVLSRDTPHHRSHP
jgi:polyhydroxyalkanoate synthase